jgi:excisionase family DNA binding protein
MTLEEANRDRRPRIEPRYLRLEDVATYLSTSVSQAYALVRSGELPAIKLGGRGAWRVDRQKLDEFVDRLEQETQAWAKAHPLNPTERRDPGDASLR